MGRLRHQAFPGATYFVTTKCSLSISVFQVQEVAEILIRKMLEYRDKGAYALHEFVVMPNHLHLLITPGASTSLERAMQLIKGGSSHEIHRARGSKSEVWQAGFHESRVRDAADYRNKRDYIYFNPVAARLVDRPEDWLFGSACGKYQLDPIPQRLKPQGEPSNVGPKGPTPNTFSRATSA
jgi:putative transposase